MAKVNKRYNTDVIMGRIFSMMVSDLSKHANLEVPRYSSTSAVVARCEKSGDYGELRQLCIGMPDPNFNGQAYHFKAQYQIKNFLKRYCFSKDLFSTDDLKIKTNTAFVELQQTLATPRPAYRASTEVVLRRARLIVKEVLGPFDPIEHSLACRLSTKACVGFPTPRSYLHDKIAGPLTGSYGHLRWFTNHRTSCKLTDDAFSKEMRVIDALTLINVPKSYKTLRGITPNTLIGSYHSYGLGKMIEGRLKKVRIDVSRQPSFHKVIAKRESESQKYVTADLSNASNCFTSVLVRKLVPYSWYRHLNLGRLQTIRIEDKSYHMASFMAMGIGFTFPLQTLLFYAIIKAVQELLGKRGLISVFGDDLIYHRRIHPYVVGVLTDCSFILNMDKTFVDVPFRESCGGDYFKSLDVRPASPEGVGCSLGKWKYLAFLHNVVNSLTLRWTEYELCSTLHLVKREILGITGQLFLIPEDLPDYAGLKRISATWYEQQSPSVYSKKLNCKLFTCLLEVPSKKLVPTLIGYYWDALRAGRCNEDEVVQPSIWRTVRDTICWQDPRSLGLSRPKNYRSNITKQRLQLKLPTVTVKGGQGSMFRVNQAISILAS